MKRESMTIENDMKKIRLVNEAMQTLLNTTSDKIFVKTADLVYVTASASFAKMVGKDSVDEIIGKTDLEIFKDATLARRYVADDKKLLEKDANLVDYMEPIPEERGQARYGITSKYILRGEEGEVMGILGITRDVTREYFARRHYQQELRYLFELPNDTYAVSYIDVDSWRVINQRRQLIENATFQSCHTVEALCRAAVKSIYDKKSKAMEFYKKFSQKNLNEMFINGQTHLEFEYQRSMSDGSVRWVHNEIRFLTDVDNNHLCVMLSARDINTEKRQTEKLIEAAQMDRMTQVLNRETTMEQIRGIFQKEPQNSHALFMLDVDNFKSLNDTMGHQAGDEFLISLTAELKKYFRFNDVIGRVGGDEFFALLRNIEDWSVVSKKAEKFLSVIQKIASNYPNLVLSGSIGISLYPKNGETLEELYAKADEALYEAKRKGKNCFVFAE